MRSSSKSEGTTTKSKTGESKLTDLLKFSIAYYFTNSLQWSILFYLPIAMKLKGFSPHQIGFATAMFPFATLILSIPSGIINDRASTKTTTLLSLIILSLFSFLTSFLVKADQGNSPLPWYIDSFTGGLGAALLLVSSRSWFYKRFQGEKARYFTLFHIGGFLGFASGPMFTSILRNSISSGETFQIVGLLYIVPFAIYASAKGIPYHAISLKEYLKGFSNPTALPLLFLSFVQGTHFGTERAVYSLFLKSGLGFPLQAVSAIYSVVGLSLTFSTLLSGYFMDKKPKSSLNFLIWGIFFSGVFQTMTGLTNHFTDVAIVRMLHTLGDGASILATSVVFSRIFPRISMGGSYGGVRFLQTIGMMLGAQIAGSLYAIHFRLPFYVNGATMMATSVLTWVWVVSKLKKLNRKKEG